MAQAKALDALEPFLALSKSATSARAAADLVSRATSHPNTFVFSELLQTPQVQALATANPEYASYLVLLKIFSYGTYADYEQGSAPASTPSSKSQTDTAPPPQSSKSSLPSLNDVQDRKLRQLSLISLATDRASLSYPHLIKELRLTDARELEALVVSAIYAGLVSATLDPAHQVVRIGSVAPLRDLGPGAVPQLQEALQVWSGRCESTLADIDAQIAAIKKAAAARAEEKRQWDAQFNNVLEHEKNATPFLSGGDFAAGSKKPGMGRLRQRYMKRASNLMAETAAGDVGSGIGGGDGADDSEFMDVDGDDIDAAEASKRSNRRKL